MKVFVNSGNVGTPVAIELARQGQNVSLGVRNPKPIAELDKLGIAQIPFDINDENSMTAALSGHEVFFSLTPLIENFIEAGTKAIQAAKTAGIQKIVRSSAQGASSNAAIELGRMHYAVEKVLEDSGIAFTVLRPANFMQNYLDFGTPESIKAQSAFYSPIDEAKVSPIDTRDLSSVAVKVILEPWHNGRQYDLTGGESLSNWEIAELLSNALGRKINYISVPEAQATEGMLASGMPTWLVDVLSELNAFAKAGYLAAVKQDVEQILKRPPITFSTFINDHLNKFHGEA